jgi:hypothetical protein
MPTSGTKYQVPTAWPEREALREKGQFWTPDWVAEAMAAYVLIDGASKVFDPAVGAGAFFRAAKAIAHVLGKHVTLKGTELDKKTLQQAEEHGLTKKDLAHVTITDFVLKPPAGPFCSIVANPPYIRHHRLPLIVKAQLRRLSIELIGRALDARAGYHIFFLLRALQLLNKNGHLAFIMPADTCEGIFSRTLWDWITSHFSLQGVITFTPQATPFPGVDTNPVIFLIKNTNPQSDSLRWVRCMRPETPELRRWILSGFTQSKFKDLQVLRRPLSEALSTGLSRPPQLKQAPSYVLGDFAKVLRGIATGANEFFFLSASQAKTLGIPKDLLKPAIGRTRDVTGDTITGDTLAFLEAKNRPTLLFSPDDRPLEHFSIDVQKYLRVGEELGLPKRALIASRRPWYKMEVRIVPPILFAYLGRRNARFVSNLAGVIPLTGFLCVYPRRSDPTYVDKLWNVLSHPETISNLVLVGKSYGSGAIKVEPRALERLPIPDSVVTKYRLDAPTRTHQLSLYGHVTPQQLSSKVR